MNNTLKFWLIVLLSLIFVYVLPSSFNFLFFGAISYFTIRYPKYSFLFVALWFFFIDAPGELFLGESWQDTRQLPFLSIPGGGYVSLRDLVPLILLFGLMLRRRVRVRYELDNYFKFILIFFLLASLYSSIWGMSANSVFNTFLIAIKLTLFYTLPRLMDEEALIKFDHIVFSIVIVAFISQVVTLLSGLQLLDVLKVSNTRLGGDYLLITEGKAVRIFNSPYIALYAFFRALYYMIRSDRKINQGYLNLIISSVSLMIILSATRGWILALLITFLFVFLFFSSLRSVKRITTIALSFIVLLFTVQFFLPLISVQLSNSIDRFLTLEQLSEGDLSMGGDLYRVTDRAPKLLKVFSENPVFGWGFSTTYWQNRDGHVGHLNLLMNHGILGSAIMYIFYMIFLVKMSTSIAYIQGEAKAKALSGRILGLGLVFVMVINSTSYQFWGFDLEIGPMFFLSLLLTSWQLIFTEQVSNQKRA